mgnify:CR=1 FL=1
MIEIRPALPEEEHRQKELWKLAFGDSDAQIDYFYTRRPANAETLVLLENGVVETMVALFPVTLTLPDGATVSSSYIYALATHPDARKKGYGRFILNYVDFYLQERKLDCVTIVPAEASLHRFFAATGFSECFATRKVELLGYMVESTGEGDSLRSTSPKQYNQVREGLLSEAFRVSYDDDAIAYQQGLSEMAASGLYLLHVGGVQGCAAAELLNGDSLLVKELIIPPHAMAGAAALLAREFPVVRYHVRTPAFWDGLPGSYLQSFGMIKWYNQELEAAWRNERKGYMGLAFD